MAGVRGRQAAALKGRPKLARSDGYIRVRHDRKPIEAGRAIARQFLKDFPEAGYGSKVENPIDHGDGTVTFVLARLRTAD